LWLIEGFEGAAAQRLSIFVYCRQGAIHHARNASRSDAGGRNLVRLPSARC
jgi:hypothetical protein